MLNWNRLMTVTKKEFIHIKRDKPSLVISLVIPILMLLLFGYAVNTDVNHVQFTYHDASQTQESRELIQKFSHSWYFQNIGQSDSARAVEETIMKGKAKIGLVIPENYTRDLKRGKTADIQVLIDGADPTVARTAASYAVTLTNQYSSEIQQQTARQTGLLQKNGAAIVAKPSVLYNPTLESSKFNIPGVVGLILQNITIILTALSLVREKELGTIEQLIMTPVTSLELILGKLIPYILIGIYDFIVILILSNWVFGVTVNGSLFELCMLGLVFLIGSLAMGMLISTVAQNQAQAIQSALMFLLPSVLLSGFMFPRESMPDIIYWFGAIFPITHFLVILRGIILKGISVTYMMSSVIALLAIIVILIGLTAKKFTKRLD